ncbi:hypothetical protein SteCoe_23542 [Stentor coeruleus]|uniref:PX domain-containing protein n=1 Tax=Stentor coeruleus TaxID=5963 RepID=A0A1R2BJM0_9CILI|nr:hypothetical protein SteCoe_23542 [Stentor coeruleus]
MEDKSLIYEQNKNLGINTIDCAKLGPSEISQQPELEVLISDPQLIEEGFFSSNFVSYSVITKPFEWKVIREFSDFVWLREITVNNFPGIFVPPLPNMKTRGSLDETTIYKRQKCLCKFMKCLISHPLILRNEHLRIFLKQSNTQSFKEYIQSVQSEKIEDISNFPSLNGKLIGDLRDHSLKVISLGNYYEKSARIMKQLKEKAYEMIQDIDQINENILNLASISKKLEDIQDAFAFTEKYKDLYKFLNTNLLQLSEVQRKKIEMVNYNLGIFFKYSSMQHTSLKRFVDNNQSYTIIFCKALIKHYESIDKTRQFFAYYNSQNLIETSRMNNYITKQSYNNFLEFTVKQAQLSNELKTIWKELLENVHLIKFI